MIGALAEPHIERDVELGVHGFQSASAHLYEVLPELVVLLVAALELRELRPCAFGELLVVARTFGCELVHPLELRDRLRLQGFLVSPLAHPDDQQPKLSAPIAQVIVAHHVVTNERQNPRDRIADDRRTQVPNMHLLGDVRAREVDDDLGHLVDGRHSVACSIPQRFGELRRDP